MFLIYKMLLDILYLLLYMNYIIHDITFIHIIF